MGGGQDQKKANQMVSQQGREEQDAYTRANDRNQTDLSEAKDRQNQLWDPIKSGYQNIYNQASSNDYLPSIYAQFGGGASGSGGGGGGGGFAPPPDSRLTDVSKFYEDYMKTGGWDPSNVTSINDNIAKLKSLGYDPDTVNRLRGGGVFDEFSKTGGYSDNDLANIRARGTSTIPAFYAQAKADANRARAVQGGYGPGQSALMARFGRSQAAAGADAALNTELGIKSNVNQGRQWGASGMSGAEAALSDLRLQSLSGASGIEKGLVESQRAGKEFGAQNLEQRAEADRAAAQAASSAAAGRSDALTRWALQFQADQEQAGLEGMKSLYGATPNEYLAYKDFDLANRGQYAQGTGSAAGTLKSGNKSWTDWIEPVAGAAAAFA